MVPRDFSSSGPNVAIIVASALVCLAALLAAAFGIYAFFEQSFCFSSMYSVITQKYIWLSFLFMSFSRCSRSSGDDGYEMRPVRRIVGQQQTVGIYGGGGKSSESCNWLFYVYISRQAAAVALANVQSEAIAVIKPLLIVFWNAQFEMILSTQLFWQRRLSK
jgi:hypothetical protein